MSTTAAPDDIVRTHEQAAANEREPLLVLDPLREFLAAAGLDAPGDLSAEADRRRSFQRHVRAFHRRGAAPAASWSPAPQRPRRPARGAPAGGPGADRGANSASARGLRRHRGDRRALLRNGADSRRRRHRHRPAGSASPEQHNRIADELIDSLVELHAVDWTTIGLEGFGKPSGYLERQLRRFTGLWEHNKTRELPEFEQVGAGWLPTCPPPRRRPSCTATTGSAT